MIQQVKTTESDIVDVVGYPSPEVEVTGTGKAWLLRDGKLVTGTWERRAEGDVTVFTTKKGDEFQLKPGTTFVELAPTGMFTAPVTFENVRPFGSGSRFASGTLARQFPFDLPQEAIPVQRETGTFTVKSGLAEMLKGGVIMDVTTADQAKIAEDAGACAVMALERVPADIRATAASRAWPTPRRSRRSSRSSRSRSWPRRASGTSSRRRCCSRSGVDYIDESEVLTPADEEFHIDKWAFTVPFVCGARNLGEALRRIAEGAAMIRTKGEAGTGNVVEAVRHERQILRDIAEVTTLRPEQYVTKAKELGAPVELVRMVAEQGKLPGRELLGRRHRHPGRRRADDAAGRRRRVRGLGHLQVPGPRHHGARRRRGHHELRERRRAGEALARPRRPHGRASRSTRSRPACRIAAGSQGG